MRGAQHMTATQASDCGARFGFANCKVLAITEQLISFELEARLPVVAEPLTPFRALGPPVRAKLLGQRRVGRTLGIKRDAVLPAGLNNGHQREAHVTRNASRIAIKRITVAAASTACTHPDVVRLEHGRVLGLWPLEVSTCFLRR